MTKMMIQANKAFFACFFLVLAQGICSAGIFYHDLRKDPVDWYLGQPQEEGANLYVLCIDMNSDGLNDLLLSHARQGESADDEETDWKVYIKVPGGYKEVCHTIYLNWDYIALDNRGGQGTRVTTFYYDDVRGGDGREGSLAETAHLYAFETESFFSVRGEQTSPTSDTFKTLFANNYAEKIKTIPQTELTRFYEIKVFPVGKRQDFNDDIIQYEDLKTLPRTDPNSDTTGTLLTYGIILGNHTTSETLQLQAQAGGTSQTLRVKGGKGGATGKDRKQPGSKVTPTPKASEKGKPPSSNGTKPPSSQGSNAPVPPPVDVPRTPSSRQKDVSASPQKDKKPQSPPSAPRLPEEAPGQI